MPLAYRFYRRGDGGLSWVPVEDECRTDAEAVVIAAAIATPSHGAEVWQGGRLVCEVPRARLIQGSRRREAQFSPSFTFFSRDTLTFS